MFLADATQSAPYVLYVSSQQKLEFEFEKNLKMMLTICIPQKCLSCISTVSGLSRGSGSKLPSSTSNLFAKCSDVFSPSNPIQFINRTVPSFIILPGEVMTRGGG